jgi:hypothetical protein
MMGRIRIPHIPQLAGATLGWKRSMKSGSANQMLSLQIAEPLS